MCLPESPAATVRPDALPPPARGHLGRRGVRSQKAWAPFSALLLTRWMILANFPFLTCSSVKWESLCVLHKASMGDEIGYFVMELLCTPQGGIHTLHLI